MSVFRPLIITTVGIVLVSAATPSFANVSQPDRSFAMQTAQDNMSEIQDAQLAETFHAQDSVQSLAEKISKDRAAARADLKAIAQQENFNLPDHVRQDQQQDRAKLNNFAASTSSHPKQGQRGRAYVGYEIGRLQQEINLFNAELKTGTNGSLKAYAQKYLPVIQEELHAAQSINLPT